MALSKRFTSITSVADPASQDDDAYDDEILQRLLKKPTNYSKIVPSKLDFQPCRDVVTTEFSDDELDEDWADDFKSLLKSCESKRSEIKSEYTAAKESVVENDTNKYDLATSENLNECDQIDINDTNSSAEYSYTCLSGGKDSTSIQDPYKIEDQLAENENDDCAVKNDFILPEQETQKDTKNSEVTVCKSSEKVIAGNECHFDRKSNSKKSLFSPKQRPESEKCLKDENKKSLGQRKDKDITVCNDKVETSRKSGSKNCSQNEKMEQNFKKNRKDLEACKDTKETNNSENRIIEKPTNVNLETVPVKDKGTKKSEQKHQGTDFTLTYKLTKTQTQTDTDFEDTIAKTTQNSQSVEHGTITKQNNRNSLPSEGLSELPLKSRNNEAKKYKPLVIKEATSFPLDELLPKAAPCKKPRTSLDSNINSNQDFPSSARKRHKSEMLTSNKGYVKKQKVDTEQMVHINERALESKHPSGSVSYIPEDVTKLLAAVDTNQSLLSFFRQELHMETGTCSMFTDQNIQAPTSSKPVGFYTERNDRALHSLGKDLESNNSSEELFHLLVQQCSELVKNEEDRWKLQSLVNLLKSESGSEFAGTGFTPELENDDSPSPPSPNRKSPPSPYSPESKLSATQTFEGRTLLKGGVDARHIPKTFLAKLGKSRPKDPRTYSTSDRAIVLPLPKFAEEFWKKEKVKQLRKKNLVIKNDLESKNFASSKPHKTVNSKDVRQDTSNFEPDQHTICDAQDQDRILNKCYMSDRLDQNQNLLREEKMHIVKETAIAGVQDPGFYAAVADIFSGDESVPSEYQGKAYDSYKVDTNFETNNTSNISASLDGKEMQQNDFGHSKKTVPTGHRYAPTGKPFQSQEHTKTDHNVSVVSNGTPLKSNIQTRPCIGIVKPMPLNPQLQNEVRVGQTQFVDVDVRHIGMDLSSDIEEGEINDRKEDREILKKTTKEFVKHASKYKKENKDRILDRIEKYKSQRTDSDSSSSVSSENRNHKRSWRRNDNNRAERSRRSRSRSCSSVDSRSSGRTFVDRRRDYRPTQSYRSHHDERRFNRGTHGRQDYASKFSDRKSYHTGKSRFDHRRIESSASRGSSHSAYVGTSKGFNDDKRHVKKVQQQSEAKVMHSTNSKKERRSSAEAADLEEERFLLDYKEKFGSKSSYGNHVSPKSHRVAQSTELPDYYKADREFLNYSLKKIDMADKVKHDYVANSSILKAQEQQEGSDTQIVNALKNRNEKQSINTVAQSKSVLGSLDSNSHSSVKKSRPATDETRCFKYSDMFSLADLEESENFIFKSKK